MKKFVTFAFLIILFVVPAVASASEDFSLNITDPKGGEEFKTGQTVRINWNQVNIDKVIISLEVEPGTTESITPNQIVIDKSLSSSFYDWTIPDNILEIGEIKKSNLRIMIIANDTGVGNLTAFSNNFSISTSKPYLETSLDSSSPSGKLVYGSDLTSAKFKLQAKGGALSINTLNLYLKDKNSSDYFNTIRNVKVFNSKGEQINTGTELSLSTVTLKEPLVLQEGATETILISFDPYKTFPGYTGTDFNFCLKYSPSTTASFQGVTATVGALCANRVSTSEDSVYSLPDLKITGSLIMPTVENGKKTIEIYFESLPEKTFKPFKIKLSDKNSSLISYQEITTPFVKNVPFYLPAGNYNLVFAIDSDNVISENNENNNIYEKAVEIITGDTTKPVNSNNRDLTILSSYSNLSEKHALGEKNVELTKFRLQSGSNNLYLKSLLFNIDKNYNDYLENLELFVNGQKTGQTLASATYSTRKSFLPDGRENNFENYLFDKFSFNYFLTKQNSVEISVRGKIKDNVIGSLPGDVNLKLWEMAAENENKTVSTGPGEGILPLPGKQIIIVKQIISQEIKTPEPVKDKNTSGENVKEIIKPIAANSSDNSLVLKLQRKISELENKVIDLEKKATQVDQKFANKYAGTMFLDVENQGRLWYVDPTSKNRFYFENGESALSIGSKLATGISYNDIQKIPVGVSDKLYNLIDTDKDGLADNLEVALGLDPNKTDTDGDGYNDKTELNNGYNPVGSQKYLHDKKLTDRLEGKMLLQVAGANSHGEIWYISKGKRWYGGTQDSMYEIMKAMSLGAVSENIRKIEVGGVSGSE